MRAREAGQTFSLTRLPSNAFSFVIPLHLLQVHLLLSLFIHSLIQSIDQSLVPQSSKPLHSMPHVTARCWLEFFFPSETV